MFGRISHLGVILLATGLVHSAVFGADTDADGVPDGIDVCWNTVAGSIVDAVGRPLGDVDEDCDVDLADFAIFAVNMTGPGGCIPEVCDGADNDCDGLIDELGSVECGLGACRNEVEACSNGVSQTCTPLPPQQEVCNGVDDDCNGLIDDSLDLLTDVNNCGSCGVECPTAGHAMRFCNAGTCGFECSPGYVDCDLDPANGCEAQLESDALNCGACGNICPTYPNGVSACNNSICSVYCDFLGGWDDCNNDLSDGCESNLYSIEACGGCGNVCDCAHGTEVCREGPMGLRCECGVCDSGWMTCGGYPEDGCAVNIASDPNNCGFCGFACGSGQTCDNGSCCDPGYRNCDGGLLGDCEVNILNDPDNCGACDFPCAPGQTCANGSCVDS